MDLPSGLTLIFSHRPILPLESGVFNLHGHVHNSPTPELGVSHVNLSVEVRDYRPGRMGVRGRLRPHPGAPQVYLLVAAGLLLSAFWRGRQVRV